MSSGSIERMLVAGAVVAALGLPSRAAATTLRPETIKAWDAYVAATEARIADELAAPDSPRATDPADPSGRTIEVPDGLISHWRGAIFLPGVHLETLLDRLQHPSESGLHQEDVLALHVLDRSRDRLKLFIRMARRQIVTVTYDTEHDVTYRRESPTRASSRSVATKIVEVEEAGTAGERQRPEGHDRGFLWRLNSYWRYEEVDGGVRVELESLTLSRDVPFGLKRIVAPIIRHVARESMSRTLDSLRASYATIEADGLANAF